MGNSSRSEQSRRAMLGLSIAAVLVAACSSSAGNSAGSTSPSSRSASSASSSLSTTTTTEPPASRSVDAVQAIIQQRFATRDALVAKLDQNPNAANDPNNADVAAYRALFTADSDFPAGYVAELQDLAAKGYRKQPGPSGIAVQTQVYGPLSVTSADDVTFAFCGYSDTATVDSTGTIIDQGITIIPGQGTARRVGGHWLLVQFGASQPSDIEHLPPGSTQRCRQPGPKP